jgi:hypothetical protein
MNIKWGTILGWQPAEQEGEGGDEYDQSTSYACMKIE